jgi:hypothetical protein
MRGIEMSYERGDGKVWLPIHDTPPMPEPNPFTEEEWAMGLKALAAHKRAFGGIMLPDKLHWEGMKAAEKRKYIKMAQEMLK